MYIDDYGNEFETREKAEQYYHDNFINEVLKDPIEISEYFSFEIEEVLKWIFQDHSELLPDFYKKFSSILECAEKNYVDNRLWDLEEIE